MLVGTNQYGKAPALLLDPKSRFGPCDEARVIARVAHAARGIETPLPVVFGRRVLGYVVGRRGSQSVLWCAGLPSLEYLNAQANSGFRWRQVFSKAASAQAFWWFDQWPVAGDPVPGGYSGAAFTAVQFSETTTGSLWHGGNQSPMTKHMARFVVTSSAGNTVLMLYDRVLTYEACTFNASSLQSMTNTLAAQRYISAGQKGLQIIITCQTTTGATAANLTQLAYTDDAGNTAQAAPCSTPALPFAASATGQSVTGALCFCPWDATNGTSQPFIPLGLGDNGVRKIESYTTSAVNTGTFTFVLVRPMAFLNMPAAGITFDTDFVYQVAAMERVYDGACLSLLMYSGPSSPTPTFTGYVETVWG